MILISTIRVECQIEKELIDLLNLKGNLFYRMRIYPQGLIQIDLMKEMKMIGAIGGEICLVLCVFFAPLITQIFPIYSITWTLYMNSTMENSNQVSTWTFTSKSRFGPVWKRWLMFVFIYSNENYFKTCLQLWPSS